MDFTESKARYVPQGTQKTVKQINLLLPKILNQIGERFSTRPDLLLAAWPEVVGDHLASMTEAISFREGILYVVVKNSTLYSLLDQYDKPRIIQKLRKKFPKTMIKTVLFRLG